MSIIPIALTQASPVIVRDNNNPSDSRSVLVPLNQAIEKLSQNNISQDNNSNNILFKLFAGLGTIGLGLYTFYYYNKLAYGEANTPPSGQDRLYSCINTKAEDFINNKKYSDKNHQTYDLYNLKEKALLYIHKKEKNIFTRWWKFCQMGLQSNNGKKLFSFTQSNVTSELLEKLYAELKAENKLAHQDAEGLKKFINRTRDPVNRNKRKRHYL